MNFFTRLFESIREAFRPTPEPDWAAIADRGHWPTDVPRGRWVAGA